MKKINVYEFNDGLDGIVVAKSLKQAAKKINAFYKCKSNDIIEDWTVDIYSIKKKKGVKSEIKGWCQW